MNQHQDETLRSNIFILAVSAIVAYFVLSHFFEHNNVIAIALTVLSLWFYIFSFIHLTSETITISTPFFLKLELKWPEVSRVEVIKYPIFFRGMQLGNTEGRFLVPTSVGKRILKMQYPRLYKTFPNLSVCFGIPALIGVKGSTVVKKISERISS